MVEKFPKLVTDTESQMQDTYQGIYALATGYPRCRRGDGGNAERSQDQTTCRGARTSHSDFCPECGILERRNWH